MHIPLVDVGFRGRGFLASKLGAEGSHKLAKAERSLKKPGPAQPFERHDLAALNPYL